MDTTIYAEIERLKSPKSAVYNEAFQNLVDRKSEATNALLELLGGANEHARQLAAEAIANIADSTCADTIYTYINDRNEIVRSWSAISLRRMGDPRAREALIRTIDDYPDELHYDHTLSSYALIQWGTAILPEILELLNDPKSQTRNHAFVVLKEVVFKELGAKDKWEALWEENGSYSPTAPESHRIESIEKWNKWLAVNY